MRTFADVEDGELFYVNGGFALQRVNESSDYNCVMVYDRNIGTKLDNTEEVFRYLSEVPTKVVRLQSI